MQQHPIPQNVTQYQFRLVGDMTLKQFLELALGLLLAYLFFASNLIFIIKWPLVIVSILFGAGLAFFPVEDRPLDQWIINFLKAIYMPTRFIWKKTDKVPPLFVFAAHPPEVVNTITKTIKAPRTAQPISPLKDLSDSESERISKLDSLFTSLPPSPAPQRPSTPIVPEPTKPSVSIRKLSSPQSVANTPLPIPKAPPVSIPKADTPTPEPTQPKPELNGLVFTAPTANKSAQAVPTTTPKKITLPASPKSPNLITGVVVDTKDKLVENAIVQIIGADGIPSRAMKTNTLGQFYTSTPLSPGTYIIEVDKDSLHFPPQQLVVNDTILSPIELRATS